MGKVPEVIKDAAQEICAKYNINGICDPMYICNVIALELYLGDGVSNFGKTGGPYTSDDVMRLANRLNHSYATCLAGEDSYQLLKEKLLPSP